MLASQAHVPGIESSQWSDCMLRMSGANSEIGSSLHGIYSVVVKNCVCRERDHILPGR
jgi:hypothetical protein